MPKNVIYFSTFGISVQFWPNIEFFSFWHVFSISINIFWCKWPTANFIRPMSWYRTNSSNFNHIFTKKLKISDFRSFWAFSVFWLWELIPYTNIILTALIYKYTMSFIPKKNSAWIGHCKRGFEPKNWFLHIKLIHWIFFGWNDQSPI